MNDALTKVAALYLAGTEALETWARPVMMLVIRVCWGFQFYQTGWGKLTNHEKVARWFGEDLGIPFADLNAWMAGGTECFGGLLLLVGLGGRVVAIPLAFTMLVAFATSDREALAGITLTNWDSALEAAPFLFLFASVLVIVFGSGPLSVDGLIDRWWRGRAAPKG